MVMIAVDLLAMRFQSARMVCIDFIYGNSGGVAAGIALYFP